MTRKSRIDELQINDDCTAVHGSVRRRDRPEDNVGIAAHALRYGRRPQELALRRLQKSRSVETIVLLSVL